MQDCVNSNKIKENKYKILRMSLLLGSGVDREDTFNNFEDAAREIDAMNDEVYIKNIEDKFYDTLKLEDEEKKLAVLVDYIGGRVEQRISLLSDFANVTGYDLQNLPSIKYYDKLDDYKERLNYIREYLRNIEQINLLNDEIENADKKLNEAYLNRASSEEYNKKIEDTLLDKFVSIFKTLEFFKEINEINLEEKINEVVYNVEDSKKSLDIFTKSFKALSGSGISYEEEKEYLSYVDNAKCAYYTYKEQEYVLRIYKLLLSKYTDYGQILYKREEINDILYERLKLRKELSVSNGDLFNNIYDLLERQYEDIKRQSVDIENIEKLTSKINEKRGELNRLEVENQKVEILSLLREFCIIDTYNDISSDVEGASEEVDIVNNEIDDNIDDSIEDGIDVSDIIGETTSLDMFSDNAVDENVLEDVNETVSHNKEENVTLDNPVIADDSIEEDALDNQVILVEDANGVDLELIYSKAEKVMKRVGEMLGIKVEETKIVSVSNETEKNESMDINTIEENNFEDKIEEIKDLPKEDNVIVNNDVIENPLFSNDVTEDNNVSDNPLFSSDVTEDNNVSDNPLFSNEVDTEQTPLNNPLFGGDMFDGSTGMGDFSLPNSTDGDFWFSSETPDALNELPDLNVSNDDFFANNNVADLEFPDLSMNFPDDDMEGKI